MPEKEGLPLALCGLCVLQPLRSPGWGLLLGGGGDGLEASESPAGLPGEAWVQGWRQESFWVLPQSSAAGAGVDLDG